MLWLRETKAGNGRPRANHADSGSSKILSVGASADGTLPRSLQEFGAGPWKSAKWASADGATLRM
jgi:hypothetical protein